MIKFVNYTYEPTSLCCGILTVIINDKEYRFGHDYNSNCYDYKTNRYIDGNFNEFWKSGGCVSLEYGSTEGPWELSYTENDYPDWIVELMPELIKVFNENVMYGCCGGCR